MKYDGGNAKWMGWFPEDGGHGGGWRVPRGTGRGWQAKPARQVDLNIVLLDCRRAFLLRASAASVGKA